MFDGVKFNATSDDRIRPAKQALLYTIIRPLMFIADMANSNINIEPYMHPCPRLPRSCHIVVAAFRFHSYTFCRKGHETLLSNS